MSNRVVEAPAHIALWKSGMVDVVDVGDETVLVDVENACAYALDSIASYVWNGLSHGLSVSSIVEELVPVFSAPRSVIENDVSKLARSLSDLGVLTAGQSVPVSASSAGECDAEPELAADGPSPSVAMFDDRYLAAPPNI